MIRLELPQALRDLAGITGTATLSGPTTMASVVDALEAEFPALRGTIRDPATGARRPFLRIFAAGEDLSLEAMDASLPAAVVAGSVPLVVVGAIAGG